MLKRSQQRKSRSPVSRNGESPAKLGAQIRACVRDVQVNFAESPKNYRVVTFSNVFIFSL